MKTYGSTEVQKLARISKMQAIHWTQVGAVTPLEDARGRGSRRVYSWQNLIEMMICRELNRFTIETHVMVSILQWLRNHYTPETKVHLPEEAPKGKFSIRPENIFRDARPYWDMLLEDPQTDYVYLYVHHLDKPGMKWAAGVEKWEYVASLLEAKKSVVVVNIRKLIEEVEGS